MKRFTNITSNRMGTRLPQHKEVKQLLHECKQLNGAVHQANKCHCIQKLDSWSWERMGILNANKKIKIAI